MKNLKTVFLFIISLCLPSFLVAKTWDEILTEKASLLADGSCQIVKEQYAVFVEKRLPTIASPLIKNIEIHERVEELVDVRFMTNSRISMLPDTPNNKSFVGPIYNSGLPNASKMRAGVWGRLITVPRYLDELATFFGYRPGTITIKIFEGLRDLGTQKQLFDNMFQEVKVKNPSLSDEEVEAETAKWVSPVKNNIPVHSTGAAVDVRLWNEETATFVDMGAFGVIWGAKESAPTFFEAITDEQKLNRLYLLMAMSKVGLVNYPYEFWHFSIGDRYATYWKEKDADKMYAYYGAVR